MIAVVLVSPVSPVVALVGLAVTLAAAVLVAHWGAFRPQIKRCVAASLIASLSMGTLGAVVVRADDGGAEFIMRDTCPDYEPWSVMWILKGCMLP
jgi:hypothetical protein